MFLFVFILTIKLISKVKPHGKRIHRPKTLKHKDNSTQHALREIYFLPRRFEFDVKR